MTDERGGDGAAEATDAGPPLLAVDGLTVAYGAVVAIRDVSLTVAPGEIVAALGPNGAGKTTLLRTLAGALKPQHGSVTFDGDPLTGLSPETVVRRGVALVPEGRHVFGNLTVAGEPHDRRHRAHGSRRPARRHRTVARALPHPG